MCSRKNRAQVSTYFYFHDLFMKRTIYILYALIFFSSCSTDVIIPCDETDEHSGNLCREYRYYNSSSVGYVEFEYKGDTAIVSYFYNQNNSLEQTTTEKLVDGRTSIITKQFPNAPSLIQSWHYNDMDSLAMIVYGGNDSLVEITFENGKRKNEFYYHNSILNRYNVYQYYQDDGKLLQISVFNAEDSLISYRKFEHFSTGQIRTTFYTSEQELIGRLVRSYSAQGLIIFSEFTAESGQVTEREDYSYDGAGKLTEQSGFIGNHSSKSVYLYY